MAAAPALGYLILGLAALLSLMVAMGTQKGYSYTFAALFTKLAEVADKVRIPTTFHTFRPLKPVADGLRWLNRLVFSLIGVWIATSEKGVAYFFTALGQLANWSHLARAALLSAVGAARSLRHLLLARLLHLQRLLTKRIAQLAHRIWTAARLRKLIRAMLRAINWPAHVLAALGRLGLGWIRAVNVVKFGKFLMRQGLDWADMLLALISPVAGTMSLREFALFMVDTEDEIRQATTRFWQVDL
jgi:hypothetical protein